MSAADASPGSGLGKEVRVPSNLGFSTNFSPDAQAATIIFDNLHVEVGPAKKGAAGAHNQTAIRTKVATLNIPYKTDQRSVTMTMDVRGFADVDSAASARLVVCAGDTTKVLALSAGKAKKVELKGKCKGTIAEEQPGAQFDDWEDRVEFTVQTHAAKPVLQITLFLLVEHDTDAADTGGALLVVDSLDLEIAAPGKAAYR
jgi:hypothetical protein